MDFLLDDKVLNEIENEGEGQQLLVKMNVLRKVLAVKDEGDMFRLLMEVYTKARRRDKGEGANEADGTSQISSSVIADGQADGNDREKNIEIDQYNAREFDENESQEDDFNDNVGGVLSRRTAEEGSTARTWEAKKSRRWISLLSSENTTPTRSSVSCPNSSMTKESTSS